MKTANDKLFRLIHSMTPGERRYFQARSSQHGREEAHYLQLYEHILDMETWSANDLKSSLQHKSWVKQLAMVKRYLWERLLEALAAYQANSSVEARIRQKIDFVAVLVGRKMWTEALAEIRQCKKQVQDIAAFYFLPQLIHFEKACLEGQLARKTKLERIDLWLQYANQAIEQQRTSIDHSYLRFMVSIYHLSKDKNPFLKERVQVLFSNLEVPTDTHWRAAINYWQAMATFQFSLGNVQAARNANESLLQLLEKGQLKDKSLSRRYLAVFYNLLIDQLQLGEYESLAKGISKLKQIVQNQHYQFIPNLQALIFQWSNNLELNALLSQQNYLDHGLNLAYRKEQLLHFETSIAPQSALSLRYLLALCFFYQGNYQEAQDLLSPLYQEQRPAIMSGLYDYARILLLLIHYEQEHHQLLEAMLRAEKRRFQNAKKTDRVLSLLFQQLEVLLSSPSMQKKKQWRDWQQQLEVIKPSPQEATSLQYFDYSYYLAKKSTS